MPTGNIVADNYIDDPNRTVSEMQTALNGLYDYVRSIKAELSVLSRQEFRGSAVLDPMELMPARTIMIWPDSVETIPTGWALCDGTNGTPDMRGLFPIGANATYPEASVGGSADAVVVSHSHTGSTGSAGYHGHSGSTNAAGNHRHPINTAFGGSDETKEISTGERSGSETFYTGYAGNHAHSLSIYGAGSHTHSVSVSSTGESGTGKNLPPYRAVNFIMRLPWSV